MIRILDENLNVLETITAYTSASWTHRFTDVGSFEVHIPLEKCPALLNQAVYIKHYDNYGIISYLHQDNSYVSIKGYDLKGLLSYRMAFGSKSGKLETVTKEYVTENTQGKRAFPLFSVSEDKQTGDDVTYIIETPGERLDNLCKNLCEQYGIGYTIYVKDKQILFDTVSPTVRDYTYSKRRNNINSYEYTKDKLNDINCAYRVLTPSGFKMIPDEDDINGVTIEPGVACYKDGYVAKITEEHRFGVLNTRPYYFYVSYNPSTKNVTVNTSSTLTPEKMAASTSPLYFYIGCLTTGVVSENNVSSRIIRVIDNDTLVGLERKEGIVSFGKNNAENAETLNKYLTENKEVENIQAGILDPSNYRKEWELGDYINIRIDVMGETLTVSRQVSEITEVFEPGNHTVSCVFGNVRESIIRKLMKGRLK